MNTWMRFAAIVFVGGMVGAGCNELLGTEVGTYLLESEAIECTAGSLQLNMPVPILESPSGEFIQAGEHEFRWQGETGAYVVQFAYDENFSTVNTTVEVNENKVRYNVKHGGDLFWRVRSETDCGDSAFSKANQLHVTCNPISLRKKNGVHYHRPAIAWNPEGNEYGIVLNRSDATGNHLEFMRVKSDGTVLDGNDQSPKEILVGADVGTSSNPDIAYVATNKLWAVIAYVETAGFPFVMLLNSAGAIVKEWPLLDSPGSNFNNIAFHHDPPSIVVSTSSKVPGETVMTIYRFAADLTQENVFVEIGRLTQSEHLGRCGTMINLVDSPTATQSVFAGFDMSYPGEEIGIDHHRTYIQRVDWDSTGKVNPAWVKMENFYSGKSVFDMSYEGFGVLPGLASSPNHVGIAYTLVPEKEDAPKLHDVHFGLIHPKSGSADELIIINKGLASAGVAELPEIAWDNDEFLVLWNGIDGNDRRIFLSKANKEGDVKPFSIINPSQNHAAIPDSPGKSLVGHDGIHAFVFEEWNDPAYKSIALCIEPPY